MPKNHIEAVQHASRSSDRRTPVRLFAQLDQEFQFVVDAAADARNKLCPHYFGLDHSLPSLRDGLQVDWAAFVKSCYAVTGVLSRCAVWINPPYAREHKQPIGPWVEKCWLESQRGVTVVGIIPYSPQTIWWREFVEGHGRELKDFHAAREVRKIPHRVTFLRPDGSVEGNAGGNTAVVVWKAKHGIQAPWVPFNCYWDYEQLGLEGVPDEK